VRRTLRFIRRQLTGRRLILHLAVTATLLASYALFERRVASSFEAATAALPTRIYARPLILQTGERPDRERVDAHLRRTGYRRVRGQVGSGEYRLDSSEWRIGRHPMRIAGVWDPGGVVRVRLERRGRIRAIRSAEGGELPGVVLEPELIGTLWGETRRDRVPVRLDEVPDHLVQAILTVEDRRFFDHGGVDLRRIAGAMVANLRARRITQGGSTLTQQLARTLFLSPDRTLFRKLRETAIAFALERRVSKERLLEAYLNHIYLGQNGAAAIHGVGRAAQFYFGHDVSDLSVEESALLAGVIRGPSLYAPFRNPAAARARRDLVLAMMHERGELGARTLEQATDHPLELRDRRSARLSPRYYLDHLAAELRESFTESELQTGGFAVIASLEPSLQRAAEDAVRRGLEALESQFAHLKRDGRPLQAALVALDPSSGEILAMVGGRSYGSSQFNRASRARRQPGSVFKPVVALTALARAVERRDPFTLASTLEDVPLSVETRQGLWTPSNYDGEFYGDLSLREALEGSRNVPFARLGLEVGPERIIETARALGITSHLTAVPSLALGASEVSLLEMTGAYGVLAAEGLRVPPRAVRAVLDSEGRRLEDLETGTPERAFTPAETYLVTSALLGAVERGTGRGVRAYGYDGPVAAKSGTTNGYRDAWFVGYTPELTVGVWVGFDDGGRIGLPGSRAALPVFARFLRTALGPEGGADFQVPSGVEVVHVDPATGLRAGWGCYGEPEIFLAGTVPEEGCGDRWNTRRWWDRRIRVESDRLGREAARWLRSRLRELEREGVKILHGDNPR
jgi:penicillin-binding protein 1B